MNMHRRHTDYFRRLTMQGTKITPERLERIYDGTDQPAFPAVFPQPVAQGMTLRDYFAVHADQPGASEIVAMAGLVWSKMMVWRPEDPGRAIGSFDDWWASVPIAERVALSARVRFAIADAMLAERTK